MQIERGYISSIAGEIRQNAIHFRRSGEMMADSQYNQENSVRHLNEAVRLEGILAQVEALLNQDPDREFFTLE